MAKTWRGMRLEAGWTQVQLAEAAGCSEGSVSRLESGKSVSERIRTRIAEALATRRPVPTSATRS